MIALAFVAVAVFGALTLYHDVRDDRTLSHRGLVTTGQLADAGCRLCKAVGVTFTTAKGEKVSAVVSAIGPQSNTTISLRYDPLHPTVVHPAHGVREEEAIALALAVVGFFAALRCYGLPHRRRHRRRGPRVRTRGGMGGEAHGHVRVVRD
ncbi:hypothetical protein acdb102_35970 [Acidothermaceae bacterium B102]|nr:hypothetical protein acdb102_35970 [Acidothermaceae bacterium B102]